MYGEVRAQVRHARLIISCQNCPDQNCHVSGNDRSREPSFRAKAHCQSIWDTSPSCVWSSSHMGATESASFVVVSHDDLCQTYPQVMVGQRQSSAQVGEYAASASQEREDRNNRPPLKKSTIQDMMSTLCALRYECLRHDTLVITQKLWRLVTYTYRREVRKQAYSLLGALKRGEVG